MTERARKEYMDYCMIVNSAKEEGIVIGEERAKLEAARNMLLGSSNSVDNIALWLGLPLETVQQLAQEMNLSK